MAKHCFRKRGSAGKTTYKFGMTDASLKEYLDKNPEMEEIEEPAADPNVKFGMPGMDLSGRGQYTKQLSGDFKDLMGKMKKEAGSKGKMEEW